MKKLLLFIAGIFFIGSYCYSQAPNIEWQNDIGGSFDDYLNIILKTDDGGYILGGHSNSQISGDKTEDKHQIDYWIVKTDSLGNIQWQNTIGGNWDDYLSSMCQVNDGGYVLAGYTFSDSSYDKTEANIGNWDFWIVKLDSIGDIIWQNTIGGTGADYVRSINPTSDGGCIAGGLSTSDISGDKTENLIGGAYGDYWVVKLDSLGNVEWDNTIGGNYHDELRSVKQLNDGKYILGGDSFSDISGDKTEPSVGGDYNCDLWILQLDENGVIEWQNTIGGDSFDALRDIEQTNDGGFIVTAYSISGITGDKTENNYGGGDEWIIKLDTVGNIIWQNTIGSYSYDNAADIDQTGGDNYILTGTSSSGISGDKTEAGYGAVDYWVIKLSSLGDILWQKSIGGSLGDESYSVEETDNGGYIIAGYTLSPTSGNKTDSAMGGYDYWILKLGSDCNLIPELCNNADDNCNGLIDEDLSLVNYYADEDSDGYGNSELDSISCFLLLPGYVQDSTDCNDANPLIFPDAPELQDGLDNNCNGETDEELVVFDSFQYANRFSVYPNPSTGSFAVLAVLSSAKQLLPETMYIIEIYNSLGQIIYTQQINSSDNNFTETISLNNISSGIYFVRVGDGNNYAEQKLIIEK